MGPGLCVRHLRCLHPYAHVRSLGVVEADYALKLGLAFFSGGYGHLVQPFGLQDAVGAFRHSVLEGGALWVMLMPTPCLFNSDTYASLQYWHPLSEWCFPFIGREGAQRPGGDKPAAG